MLIYYNEVQIKYQKKMTVQQIVQQKVTITTERNKIQIKAKAKGKLTVETNAEQTPLMELAPKCANALSPTCGISMDLA